AAAGIPPGREPVRRQGQSAHRCATTQTPAPDAPRQEVMARARFALGILAGGQGMRAGGADKGWVMHDGRAQVAHVRDAVAAKRAVLAQTGDVQVADPGRVTANSSIARYADLGVTVVPERWPGYPGPMA